MPDQTDLAAARVTAARPAERLAVVTERLDAAPLLLAHIQRMRLPTFCDAHFGTLHGKPIGWYLAVWISAILSSGELRPDGVGVWAAQRAELLRRVTGQLMSAADFDEITLEQLLLLLADERRWSNFERDLANELAVYQLVDPPPLLEAALRLATQANDAIRINLAAATDALYALNRRRRGKFTSLPELREAAEAIVNIHQLNGIVQIVCEERVSTRQVRRYRGRPDAERVERNIRLTYTVDEDALLRHAWRQGWWAYATTMPLEQLSLMGTLLAYRSAYLLERGSDRFARLFAIAPDVAVPQERALVGLVRLLTLAAQVLTVLDTIALERGAERVAGEPLAAHTGPLIGERLLGAFSGITLTIIMPESGGRRLYLTKLSGGQRAILAALGLPDDTYDRLVS